MEVSPQALFAVPDSPALPGQTALLGGQCNACGHVFFPMQAYGCECCGSVDLAPRMIGGRGVLIASARVHMSINPAWPAPYTVGSIVTDDGAVVQSVLNVDPVADLVPGTTMLTELVAETRPNCGPWALRFALAGSEA